jgi:hypothetical protein
MIIRKRLCIVEVDDAKRFCLLLFGVSRSCYRRQCDVSGAASETEENSAAVYRSSNRGEPTQVGHSRSSDDIGRSGAVAKICRVE